MDKLGSVRAIVAGAAAVMSFCGAAVLAQEGKLDTAMIEKATEAKGAMFAQEGVFKVGLSRTDLAVTVAGTKMTAPMGLGCWASFMKAGSQTMVMGDMALLQDQVNPVMDAALGSGLEVTALHNHFLWDSPHVMFMHVGGVGEERKLAEGVGKVFAAVKATMGGKGDTPRLEIDVSKSSIDGKRIEEVLGHKGEPQPGGIFKVTIGRKTAMHGHEVGNAMGVNTWTAFAGNDTMAVCDGDFAMTEQELQPVLKALRAARINVVAIHNHMTMDQPRIMFLHFWGVGAPAELAKGLKAALDAQYKATM